GDLTVKSTTGKVAVGVTSVDEDEIVLTITKNDGVFGTDKADKLVISGIDISASKTATGVLNITVGDAGAAGEADNVPGTVLGVATATARGTVTIEGPDPVTLVGKAQKNVSTTSTLEESAHGTITTANANTTTINTIRPAVVSVAYVSVDS